MCFFLPSARIRLLSTPEKNQLISGDKKTFRKKNKLISQDKKTFFQLFFLLPIINFSKKKVQCFFFLNVSFHSDLPPSLYFLFFLICSGYIKHSGLRVKQVPSFSTEARYSDPQCQELSLQSAQLAHLFPTHLTWVAVTSFSNNGLV